MKTTYHPWLDWLRFLAAFIVVTGHSRDQLFVKYADLTERNIFITIWFMLTRLGNEAVMMFFVLSGFLVGGLALQRINDGTFKLKDYAIDRFTRIYLPLIPALLLTFGMQYYLSGDYNLTHIGAALLSLQGVVTGETIPENEALWSLSYEVWFYILIVSTALWFKRKYIFSFLIIVTFGLVFTKLSLHYFLCWLVGAIAYLTAPKKVSKTLLIIGLMLCLYGSFGKQLNRGSESIDIKWLEIFIPSMEVARLIFSAGFALLIQQLVLMKPKGALAKIERWGVPLAAFSYTLYLTHSPIIRFFKHGLDYTNIETINVNSFGIYIALILSSIMVSLIMYWLFEKNTNYIRSKLKRFFSTYKQPYMD